MGASTSTATMAAPGGARTAVIVLVAVLALLAVLAVLGVLLLRGLP
jgi:hypothetical protein